MEQLGYSLIDSNNNEVQYWGDTPGILFGMPDVIFLPNSDIVNAPNLNVNYSGYTLVQRWLDANPPSQFYIAINKTIVFDGEKVVVAYIYSDKPNVVPQIVSPLQMRLALNRMGLRTTLDDYIKTLDQDTQDAWEYATEILRSNSIIINVAQALGKTDEEVDDLFRLAASLV